MTARDGGTEATSLRIAAQHHRHCPEGSFRNHSAGNVAHDRCPQTVALINCRPPALQLRLFLPVSASRQQRPFTENWVTDMELALDPLLSDNKA
jgi:hypothetical protein